MKKGKIILIIIGIIFGLWIIGSLFSALNEAEIKAQKVKNEQSLAEQRAKAEIEKAKAEAEKAKAEAAKKPTTIIQSQPQQQSSRIQIPSQSRYQSPAVQMPKIDTTPPPIQQFDTYSYQQRFNDINRGMNQIQCTPNAGNGYNCFY